MKDHMPVVSDAGTVSHLRMSEDVSGYSHLIYYAVRKAKPLLHSPSPYTIIVDRVYVEDGKFLGLSAIVHGDLSKYVKSIEVSHVDLVFRANGDKIVRFDGELFCSFDINQTTEKLEPSIVEYMRFCEWFYSDADR